jgi:purine-binding chemotaxis protein CheW
VRDTESILHTRARELARRPRDRAGPEREIVTFRLAGDRYGVESHRLREIFRPRDLTLLPGAEPPLYAVAPWRGVLLTILDVRALLGVHGGGITDLSHVLVLGADRASIGVLIHTVQEIVHFEEDELVRPSARRSADEELLLGVTRDGVLVLDAATLLKRYG